MNWLPLFSLLAGLASNKYVKSALISLAGVIGAAITQSATGQDLSGTGAAIAAGVSAWLANLLKDLAPLLLAWLQATLAGKTTTPAELDLQKLDLLGPLTDEQIANLRAGGYDVEYVPPSPAPAMDMAKLSGGPDDVPFSLLWLVPLLWLCCSAAQAAPPKAVLVGPTSARPGVPIHLDVTQSAGDIQHYILKVRPETDDSPTIQYAVRTKEEGKAPVVDRSKPFIWGVPGTWEIQLTVVSPDGEADDTSITVTIPGATPCPDPQPVKPQPVTPQPIPVDPAPPRPPAPEPVIPTPAPQPVTPTPPAPTPGRFGIAARVRAAVLGVSSPTRAIEVAGLRGALGALMTRARSGQLTQQQFLDSLVAELKALPDSWQVVKTLAALGIRVLVTGGQLKTVDDFIDLAAEILQAIEGL